MEDSSLSPITSPLPSSNTHQVDPQLLQKLENISFEGLDEDLLAFQEDEMVQQALQRGVDLKKYGNELEQELRKVN